MTYSSEDLELLWLRYQADGLTPLSKDRYVLALWKERSLSFFKSHSMAKLAVIYHTVISTCKMIGCSAI